MLYLIGSFSNDDGDGNKNVKKAIGLIIMTRVLHVQHAFCKFLCRHCTVTTQKCLISRFMEDEHKRRRIFFSLSKLDCGRQGFNSKEICLHLTFSAELDYMRQSLKKREFISKVTFSLSSPSSMLRLSNLSTRSSRP